MRFHIERAKASTAREGVHRVWKTRRWYEHEECSGTKCSKQDHAGTRSTCPRSAEHYSARQRRHRDSAGWPTCATKHRIQQFNGNKWLAKAATSRCTPQISRSAPSSIRGITFLLRFISAASWRATQGPLHPSPSNSRSNAPRSGARFLQLICTSGHAVSGSDRVISG